MKHAYGLAFGIFGLAAYAETSGCAASADLAMEAFRWLEAHGYDPEHGGYREYFTRAGAPISEGMPDAPARTRDPLGTPLGCKSMNAHVHLLEALTTLYRVRPDPLVASRLVELLTLVRERMMSSAGTLHQVFQSDWTPLPSPCSYGHDIEAGYLLLDAADALGVGDDPATMRAARALVAHTLAYGWDPRFGGLFDAGEPQGPVRDRRKVWWAQAEGLNTLALMAQRFPDEPAYRQQFLALWGYVRTYQVDRRHGDWHAQGRDTRPWGGAKSTEWKCGYHHGRALLNALDWLS